MRRFLTKMIGTFFFVGELPFIPGTFGSFAGLLFYLSLGLDWGARHLAALAALLAAGFLFAGKASGYFGKKDARPVVIDEVAGIFIVFLGIRPQPLFFVAGFLIYRLLDIMKPFPAKQLEKIPGSAGIMLDDIICGCYANVLLRTFEYFYQI